ncbi:unnamed protein product [Peniophora sp. CBMAI 1063]|nr:unnamed protein product [Peniophora sp. CBMAI 1063]
MLNDGHATTTTQDVLNAATGPTSNATKKALYAERPTAILHRTPWRPPVASKAQGMEITLEDGRVLLDAVGGAAVACIGMGNERVKQAIKDQVDECAYVYSMQLSNEPAEELANLLVEQSNGAFEMCGFFAGGSEAMDAMLKLSRQFWVEQKQPQRVNYISRELSYHGNTLGTLQISGHVTRRAPYNAILNQNNFHKVSPAYAKRFQREDESEEQYVARLAKELEDKILELGKETVIGFIAETVVGATTGVVAAPKGYFAAMKAVCERYDILFCLDEVMSGMGRMGTMHAWESFGDGAAPDMQAVAKGLGGGYATIGAVLMGPRVTRGIRDGAGFMKHGHTYQSHPIACAASLAVQKEIAEGNLLANAREQGAYFGELLEKRLKESKAAPFVFDVRGGGAFWGVEFDFDCPEGKGYKFNQPFAMAAQARALQNDLIIIGMTGGARLDNTKGDTSIFAPAYNVTREQVEKIVDVYVKSVEEVLAESAVQ